MKLLKKLLPLLFALCLFCGCAAKPAGLTVFAAASLTETLTELGELYEKETGNKVVFNFDSSGTLQKQIEQGADCDLFFSAGQKQMDALTDLVTDRVDLLENKVVLCGNCACFDELAERLQSGTVLLAMGNSDVPVGQYAQKILSYFGLDEQALAENGCISYGSNAKEVTSQVAEGAADCGVIYATDARSAGLAVRDAATEAMCGRVIYPAAVLKNADPKASDFLQFCIAHPELFEAAGFTVIAEKE